MGHYYMLIKMWVYCNTVLILSFIIAFFTRLLNPDINKKIMNLSPLQSLRFPHLSILNLWFTNQMGPLTMAMVFASNLYKFTTFRVFHHPNSLPEWIRTWWVNPTGFCVKYSELEPLIYIYAGTFMFFHYKIYHRSYEDLNTTGLRDGALIEFVSLCWCCCSEIAQITCHLALVDS